MPSCGVSTSVFILAVIILSAAFISLDFFKQCPDVTVKDKENKKMFLTSMIGMGVIVTVGILYVIYF